MAVKEPDKRAAELVARAYDALALGDGLSVQRLCGAAIECVPGHEAAVSLMQSANPHGWACHCDPCKKGRVPASRVVGGPVEDVPQGDGKKPKKEGA